MSTTAAPAPPATTAAIDVRGAVRTYGSGESQVRALDGVSVALPAQRFTAIMGPSGSGKSTLMHCAAGLDRLDAGEVRIGGEALGDMSDRALTVLRRERIGFVFQAFNLVPTLTAAENIELPLLLAGRHAEPQRLESVAAAVGLSDRLGHRPAELSGGQCQRVAVARALVTEPDVVVADEPTGNLDSRSGAEVLGLLRRAVDDMGRTVVMVTHDPVAAARADGVVLLADGLVVDELSRPTPDELLDRLKDLSAPVPAAAEGPAAGSRLGARS